MHARIKLLPGGQLPTKGSDEAAGWDLYAAETLWIPSDDTVAVCCAFILEMPVGWEAQIRSRSGMALKGWAVANSPGTVDSDYRGEIKVLLRNHTGYGQYIHLGDRIAQMVFKQVPEVTISEVASVDEMRQTKRGTGGYGSTGQ